MGLGVVCRAVDEVLGLERLVASWMAVRSQTAATMWLDHQVMSQVIRQRLGEVRICCHQSRAEEFGLSSFRKDPLRANENDEEDQQ